MPVRIVYPHTTRFKLLNIKRPTEKEVIKLLEEYDFYLRILLERDNHLKGFWGLLKRVIRYFQGNKDEFIGDYSRSAIHGHLFVLMEILNYLGQENLVDQIWKKAYDDMLRNKLIHKVEYERVNKAGS